MDALEPISQLSETDQQGIRQAIAGFIRQHFRYQWDELERQAIQCAQNARRTDTIVEKNKPGGSAPESEADIIAAAENEVEKLSRVIHARIDQSRLGLDIVVQEAQFCDDVLEHPAYAAFAQQLANKFPSLTPADMSVVLFWAVDTDLAETRLAVHPTPLATPQPTAPAADWASDIAHYLPGDASRRH
jgi:hypothetical protein